MTRGGCSYACTDDLRLGADVYTRVCDYLLRYTKTLNPPKQEHAEDLKQEVSDKRDETAFWLGDLKAALDPFSESFSDRLNNPRTTNEEFLSKVNSFER